MTVIELALEADRPAIESLLVGSGLPLDGLEIALPTAVVASPEFAGACPQGAAVLHKRL